MEDDYKPPLELKWGTHFVHGRNTALLQSKINGVAMPHVNHDASSDSWPKVSENAPVCAVAFPNGSVTDSLTKYQALKLAWMFNTVHKGVDEDDR